MEEIWKDIEGYKDLYQISNLGRVKTLPLKKPLPKGDLYQTKERIRKLDSRRGYPSTKLWRHNLYVHKSVHRLVAEAFVPNPNNLPWVHHMDSDKNNPHVSNLEWCTPQQNILYSIEEGSFPIGSRRYNSKLKEEDILDIYSLREAGNTYKEISHRYQVTLQCIYNICAGITWKHLYDSGRMVPVPKPHNYRPPKRGHKPNFSKTPMVY